MHFCISHFAHFAQLFRSLFAPLGLLALIACSGCGSTNWTAADQRTKTPPSVADATLSTPKVLLFVGNGTSSGDVSAVKTILGELGLSYATATSSQLNSMSETRIRAYRLFLMPGGNAVTISRYLTRTTTTNIHNAIVNGGMHYLGICAGAFFAGHSTYNYLSLAGTWFNFYPEYFSGVRKAAFEIHSANGITLDQYWQDGPELKGFGEVVGKYPDGIPAVVETHVGNGWVILSGVHPEAPASWRYGMNFTTPVSADNAYAKTLVTAALNGTSLPHF